MTRAELLAELRDVLDDAGLDPLWSDARLLGYLAEGQDLFCEQTGYFLDNSTYSVTLETGTASYAVPERVIEVLDIFDGRRRLGRFQEKDRSHLTPQWDPLAESTLSGRPQAWQLDGETGQITFDRTPTASENGLELTLRVWRYSQFDLAHQTAGQYDKDPEIPAAFQRALIEWAAYKAYMSHDAEKQDKVKAADHRFAFDDYCRRGKRHFARFHGQQVRIGTSPAYRT